LAVSTAALIRREGRVLLVRRAPGGALGSLWELPGGKVDASERPEQALIRELREELAIDATVGAIVARGEFSHRGVEFELLLFDVRSDLDGLTLVEHTEMCWKTPREALELQLAPSDRDVLEQLAGTDDPFPPR
jgi:mutator protein MutT